MHPWPFIQIFNEKPFYASEIDIATRSVIKIAGKEYTTFVSSETKRMFRVAEFTVEIVKS